MLCWNKVIYFYIATYATILKSVYDIYEINSMSMAPLKYRIACRGCKCCMSTEILLSNYCVDYLPLGTNVSLHSRKSSIRNIIVVKKVN